MYNLSVILYCTVQQYPWKYILRKMRHVFLFPICVCTQDMQQTTSYCCNVCNHLIMLTTSCDQRCWKRPTVHRTPIPSIHRASFSAVMVTEACWESESLTRISHFPQVLLDLQNQVSVWERFWARRSELVWYEICVEVMTTCSHGRTRLLWRHGLWHLLASVGAGDERM